MFTKRLVIHSQGQHIFRSGDGVDPIDVLGRCKRCGVMGVAKRDIVAKPVIPGQYFKWSRRMFKNVMRPISIDYPINSVDNGAVESQAADALTNVIVVNQFGVAEHLGRHAKITQYRFLMFRCLQLELSPGHSARKRVVISLCEKIHRPRFRELAEAEENFRRKFFKLLQRDARDGKSHANIRVAPDQPEKQRVRRQIARGGYTLDDVAV